MKRFFAVGWLFLGLISCEKVVQIPLSLADEQRVVEAVLKNGKGANYVKLSMSGTVYDDSGFRKIEGATVTVTNQLGEVVVFGYVGEGLYNAEEFEVVPGYLYHLSVAKDDWEVTGSCQTGLKPKIDSLTYSEIAGFNYKDGKPRFLISFHAVDHVSEENYYWVNIFRNGKINSGYYFGNDELINGLYFTAPLFGSNAKSGDTVMVEVQAIDKANYNYIVGLSGNIANSPFSAAPANPPTNLKGGALGFFGAYTTDSLTIIIP